MSTLQRWLINHVASPWTKTPAACVIRRFNFAITLNFSATIKTVRWLMINEYKEWFKSEIPVAGERFDIETWHSYRNRRQIDPRMRVIMRHTQSRSLNVRKLIPNSEINENEEFVVTINRAGNYAGARKFSIFFLDMEISDLNKIARFALCGAIAEFVWWFICSHCATLWEMSPRRFARDSSYCAWFHVRANDLRAGLVIKNFEKFDFVIENEFWDGFLLTWLLGGWSYET